ncbi:hypothetical protein OMCYN_01744 [cyanobiont of Ornithocercus magnificus]|nr:hypothetical protein OMCYN_01744 [cyanobiont of Ornithocercus magnificus]
MTRLEELAQQNIPQQGIKTEVTELIQRLYRKYIEADHANFCTSIGFPIGSILNENVVDTVLVEFVEDLSLLVEDPYRWVTTS